MEALKEKCGLDHQDILVTGEITVKKDSESNFIRTEINMKVCGLWTRNMVKVLIGEMTPINSEESTLVIGSKIKNMEEEHSSSKIVIDTMDIGSTVCHKEKVE
tara:strand:+ start:241 stop:549 length:309 start_codon:yes stop_codon:yes gene_type:complete